MCRFAHVRTCLRALASQLAVPPERLSASGGSVWLVLLCARVGHDRDSSAARQHEPSWARKCIPKSTRSANGKFNRRPTTAALSTNDATPLRPCFRCSKTAFPTCPAPSGLRCFCRSRRAQNTVAETGIMLDFCVFYYSPSVHVNTYAT